MVFCVKNFYPTILFFILITDLPASVWRTIIYEQNLKIRICLAKNAFQRSIIISLFSSTRDSANFNSAGFSPLLSNKTTSGWTWKRASALSLITCT